MKPNIPNWNPVEATSLWANYHGTDAEHALPYVAPLGAHDAYMKGEFVIYNEDCYECITDATVYSPEVLPANWKMVGAE